MERTLLAILLLLLALVTVAPTTSAGEPVCMQVYPWSKLCSGEPGDVVCYFVHGLPPEACDGLR